MPPTRDDRNDIAELSQLIQRIEVLEAANEQIQPIITTVNASKLLGRILFILGGIIVGGATVYSALSGWLTAHLR